MNAACSLKVKSISKYSNNASVWLIRKFTVSIKISNPKSPDPAVVLRYADRSGIPYSNLKFSEEFGIHGFSDSQSNYDSLEIPSLENPQILKNYNLRLKKKSIFKAIFSRDLIAPKKVY